MRRTETLRRMKAMFPDLDDPKVEQAIEVVFAEIAAAIADGGNLELCGMDMVILADAAADNPTRLTDSASCAGLTPTRLRRSRSPKPHVARSA